MVRDPLGGPRGAHPVEAVLAEALAPCRIEPDLPQSPCDGLGIGCHHADGFAQEAGLCLGESRIELRPRPGYRDDRQSQAHALLVGGPRHPDHDLDGVDPVGETALTEPEGHARGRAQSVAGFVALPALLGRDGVQPVEVEALGDCREPLHGLFRRRLPGDLLQALQDEWPVSVGLIAASRQNPNREGAGRDGQRSAFGRKVVHHGVA